MTPASQRLRHYLRLLPLLLLFIACKKNTDRCSDCSNNSITTFSLLAIDNKGLHADVRFQVDEASQQIKGNHLIWIDSPEPALLKAAFETDGGMVSVQGVMQTSHISVLDFSNPVTYTVIAKDGSKKTYTAHFICPQLNASLPVMKIDADGPINSKEVYTKASLKIFGNGITEGLWNTGSSGKKIEIRLRGNSTAWLPKKPFRIKFPDKFSPLGLNHAKEKSWVLLANDADKTLIRNALAFRASQIMNDNITQPRFTPAILFTDVYVNGTYEGNYMLTDQVEVAPGRINVESLKSSDGSNTAKISGGYHLEVDGFGASEPLYFATEKEMPVVMKYPKDDDYDVSQFDYIRNYLLRAEASLFSPDFADPILGWRKYFDSKSWIDYYIVSEITGNPDAWWSTNIFKHRDDSLLYFGPVWDFDIAFNNDLRLGDATKKLMAREGHDPRQWINQWMQDPSFKAAVKSRWNEKKNALKELITYTDALAQKIDLSQQANFFRWDISIQSLGHAAAAPANYGAGVSQLKKYVNDRLNFLEEIFSAW